MKILIVGAGIVGFNLAQELSHEGHDISIIDEDPERIKVIQEKLDVLSVQGNACLPSILVTAGIRQAEMVIAVTDKDEINLMVCILAEKFKVSNRFARLRHIEFTSDERIFDPSELHVDLAINPGKIIVEFILKIIKTPGAVNAAEFAQGEIQLRGFEVPENAPLAGKRLIELRELFEFNSFLIVAIVRNGEILIHNDGQQVIEAGDKVYTLVDKEFLPLVLPMFNKTMEVIHKLVLFGANALSIQLAKGLEAVGFNDISMIEPKIEAANEAADQLSKTVVLHGSGTDPDLFNDINISDADYFIALSNDDESNILSALLAKKHGAHRVIIITNDPDYLPILDSIGLDVTVNPRLITVGAILGHLRKGQVRSVYKMIEGEAEVIEVTVRKDSSIVNKKINKLKFPKAAIIGAILRNGEMIVPTGDCIVMEGDSVIVVTLPEALEKIEKLFGKRRFF